MRKLLLLLIGLMFLSFPAVASFSDGFDDGTFNGGWNTPVNPLFSIDTLNPSWDGTPYAYATGYSNLIKTITNNQTYWSFYFNNKPGATSYGTFTFRIDTFDTFANECSLYVYPTYIETNGAGFCSAIPSISPQLQTVPGAWYKVSITDLGSTLYIQLFNASNNTEITHRTVTDVATDPYHNIGIRSPPAGDTTKFIFDTITTSSVSSSASNSVVWGGAYVKGDFGLFTWVIRDVDWTDTYLFIPYSFNVDILKNGVIVKSVELASQTGSNYYTFPDAGTYQVKLMKNHILSIFGGTELANNSIVVRNAGDGYLLINASVPYKNPIPVQYGFGFGGIDLNYAIRTYHLNSDTGIYDFEHSYFGLNSSGTKTVYFEQTGTYIIKLMNVKAGTVYFQSSTTVNYVVPDTILNVTTSSLNITQSVYNYGAVLYGNYTVDNTNYTAGITYIDVYNLDKGATTSEFYGTGIAWADTSKQVGDVMINIFNAPKSELNPAILFLDGNNQIRLMLKNTSGARVVLAYQNFTLNMLTSTGYGLKLSKYQVYEKEKFYAYVTTPEATRLHIVDTASGANQSIFSMLINSSKGLAVPLTINKAGSYAVILNNPAGDTEIMANVEVVKVGATPTPTSTTTTSQQTSALVDLLSSNLFWALIFTVGMMTMIAFATMKREKEQ